VSLLNWRASKEYRVWRVSVIRRDSKCVVCSSLQGREAHHMNHSKYFIDERYNVDNGITLCKKCHSLFHTDYKKSYREKCTAEDFNNFIKIIKYIRNLYDKDVNSSSIITAV